MKQELNTTITDNNIEPTIINKEGSGLSWLTLAFCGAFRKMKLSRRDNSQEEEQQQPTTISFEESNAITTPYNTGILLPNKVSDQQETEMGSCSRTQSHIVPLRQFLRYSMDRSDRRNFQRRRITQPFKPMYEIEWQKNQWLQLDNATNRKIERLRKNGFSKIAIRKDQSLKKHIMYENPSEIDVLLELFLHTTKDINEIGNEPEPIVCHQPSQFSVRRTHWWHASYRIGEAHLPNWVDTDACCNAIIMDAPSVLAVITNYSETYLPSIQQSNRLPDTPSISQKSSVNHQMGSLPSSSWSIKPLKYTKPPFLMSKPFLCAA